jgi:hypothetical protein
MAAMRSMPVMRCMMYGLCVIYRMDNLTGRNCVGCYYLRSYWNTIQYEYSCSGTAHRKMSAGANCRLSTTETDYQSPNIKRQTTDVQRPTVVVKRHPPVLLQSTSHEQNSHLIVFTPGRAVEPVGSQSQSHLTWTSQRVFLGAKAWPARV